MNTRERIDGIFEGFWSRHFGKDRTTPAWPEGWDEKEIYRVGQIKRNAANAKSGTMQTGPGKFPPGPGKFPPGPGKFPGRDELFY